MFERHDADNADQYANAKADRKAKQVNVHSPHFPPLLSVIGLPTPHMVQIQPPRRPLSFHVFG
jgi:hypothetical protein